MEESASRSGDTESYMQNPSVSHTPGNQAVGLLTPTLVHPIVGVRWVLRCAAVCTLSQLVFRESECLLFFKN